MPGNKTFLFFGKQKLLAARLKSFRGNFQASKIKKLTLEKAIIFREMELYSRKIEVIYSYILGKNLQSLKIK